MKSLRQYFLGDNGIVRKFLKTMRKKKEKRIKVILFVRIKVNTIESIIPKALINNETSLEEFTISMNEAEIIVNQKNGENSKKQYSKR